MAVPMLLYVNGSWTVKIKYWMNLKASEKELIRYVKGCSKTEA
jgi:hypothetical protein